MQTIERTFSPARVDQSLTLLDERGCRSKHRELPRFGMTVQAADALPLLEAELLGKCDRFVSKCRQYSAAR